MTTRATLKEELEKWGLESQKVNLIFEDSPTYQVKGRQRGSASPSPLYAQALGTKPPPQHLNGRNRANLAQSSRVFPRSYTNVQNAVKAANNNGAQIVVRSGGHSYEALSLSPSLKNYKFLIIDLKHLTDIKVDEHTMTAWVDSGSNLGDIYKALYQIDKTYAFPGGSCPSVGSGGHISGGGIGMLARKFGLAADNVLDVKLVDAEGNLRSRYGNGSSITTMEEDVFWAICGGGGGSWGVVIAWKIKIVKVEKTLTMFRKWEKVDNNLINLIDRYQDFLIKANKEDDDNAHNTYIRFNVTNNTVDGNPEGTIARFHGLYQGSKSEFLKYMRRMFPELGLHQQPNLCKEGSWEDVVDYFAKSFGSSNLHDPVFPQKNRWKLMSDVVKQQQRMPIEGIKMMVDIIRNRPVSSLVIHPLGGAINNKEKGDTPFPYRTGSLYIIEYAFENVSSRELPSIHDAYESMRPYVSSKPRGAYVNFPNKCLGYSETGSATVEEARKWGEKYFSERNYYRLICAKMKIDPDNVFRHAQSIPADGD